jgi:hypothetical protein
MIYVRYAANTPLYSPAPPSLTAVQAITSTIITSSNSNTSAPASKYDLFFGNLRNPLKVQGRRPHFLFGLAELTLIAPPLLLPLLPNHLFDQLLPENGHCHHAKTTLTLILQMTEALKPSMSFIRPHTLSRGDSRGHSEREGHGRHEAGQGEVYEGRCEGSLRHGYGHFTSSGGGYRYKGYYDRDRRQGLGWVEEKSFETIKVPKPVVKVKRVPQIEATVVHKQKKGQPNMRKKKKRDLRKKRSEEEEGIILVEEFNDGVSHQEDEEEEEEVVQIRLTTYDGEWVDDKKCGLGTLVRLIV